MLYVTATNLKLTLVARTGCKIEQEGVVTVPAKMLAALVATLPDELVTLETDGGKFSVKCQSLHTSLPTMDAKDFPPIREVQGVEVDLPAESLANAIKCASFCVSKYTDRPTLTGISMIGDGKHLKFAAADGFSLAVYTMPCKETFKTIVPIASINRVGASIGKQEDDVKAIISTESISFHMKNLDIYTLTIQGVFPDYPRLILTEHKNRCIVNRESLLNAIKTAMIITEQEAPPIRIYLPKDGKLSLATASAVSEHHNEIEAAISGEDGKIALNGRFIEPFLTACSESNVILETNTPSSPCVMRGEGNKDYVFVTMPIFYQW
jgi:DNA polymerase-3 subunit beta